MKSEMKKIDQYSWYKNKKAQIWKFTYIQIIR